MWALMARRRRRAGLSARMQKSASEQVWTGKAGLAEVCIYGCDSSALSRWRQGVIYWGHAVYGGES